MREVNFSAVLAWSNKKGASNIKAYLVESFSHDTVTNECQLTTYQTHKSTMTSHRKHCTATLIRRIED